MAQTIDTGLVLLLTSRITQRVERLVDDNPNKAVYLDQPVTVSYIPRLERQHMTPHMLRYLESKRITIRNLRVKRIEIKDPHQGTLNVYLVEAPPKPV